MDKSALIQEWMRFACDDLEVAIILSEGRPLKHEIICFHCQQAAEKSLKRLSSHTGYHSSEDS